MSVNPSNFLGFGAGQLQAQLQLQELQNERERNRAAAVNQAIQQLVSGVGGGLNAYAGYATHQQEMKQGQENWQKQYDLNQQNVAADNARQDAASKLEANRFKAQQDQLTQQNEFSDLGARMPGIVEGVAKPTDPERFGLPDYAVTAINPANDSATPAIKDAAKHFDMFADQHVANVGPDQARQDLSDLVDAKATDLAQQYPHLSKQQIRDRIIGASIEDQRSNDALAYRKTQDAANQGRSDKTAQSEADLRKAQAAEAYAQAQRDRALAATAGMPKSTGSKDPDKDLRASVTDAKKALADIDQTINGVQRSKAYEMEGFGLAGAPTPLHDQVKALQDSRAGYEDQYKKLQSALAAKSLPPPTVDQANPVVSGATAPALNIAGAAAPSGMVTVSFNGKILQIPASKLDEALKDGATIVK